MTPEGPTERTVIHRHTERAAYDSQTVSDVLEAGLIAHVGIIHDGCPVVIPMVYAQVGDTLYLHGSVASRLMRALRTGIPACATVTVVDGLVLARSAFNMTMNYRSVVIQGTARLIESPDERAIVFRSVLDHLIPNHYDTVRPPSDSELAQTMLIGIPLTESSVKMRSGPPYDEPEDLGLPIWAGEIPLTLIASNPIPDPDLEEMIQVPASVANYKY
ncbi:MAG: pyridoxamine 5'-phosphate oxidase family protein [Acidimicrobiia bacterium]|nr:pyridoxamine 5'-phosphate oxidase family protein [Acidimicrobiia bacterium]